MDADGVRKYLAIKLERFGSNVEAAKIMGISDAHLGHVLAGKDAPGPKVLKFLGLKRVYHYEFDGLPNKP